MDHDDEGWACAACAKIKRFARQGRRYCSAACRQWAYRMRQRDGKPARSWVRRLARPKGGS
jgi:hypothetical protein